MRGCIRLACLFKVLCSLRACTCRCVGVEHFLLQLIPVLPDMEFLVNVMDYPLSSRLSGDPLPILSFSKVGSVEPGILTLCCRGMKHALSSCLSIYVCMHIYVRIHACMHIYVSIYIYVCTYTCIYKYICFCVVLVMKDTHARPQPGWRLHTVCDRYLCKTTARMEGTYLCDRYSCKTTARMGVTYCM